MKIREHSEISTNVTEVTETPKIVPNCQIPNCDIYPECRIQREIAFLKTHKTGSETMAGIFRKFAILNNVSTLISERVGGHIYQVRSLIKVGTDLPAALSRVL